MISIKDIPKFTSWGTYSVDIGWDFLEEQIDSYVKESNLQLEPDFQRGHVWTTEQQVKYVEFCLKGGKSSRNLLFNNPNWSHDKSETYNDFVLVDGLQRLTAVLKFLRNELVVFNNNYFKDFTDKPRVTLRGQRFHIYINDLSSKKEVLQWYLDLNSGGVIHSEEELNKVKSMLNTNENT